MRWTLACIAFIFCFPTHATGQQGRPWSLSETTYLREFVSLRHSGIGAAQDSILWNDDRSQFATVVVNGDGSCNCNIYRLYVFAAPFRAQREQDSVLTWRDDGQDPYKAPFQQMSWSADGRRLFFLGPNDGHLQVYELEPATRRLLQRTHHASGVYWFVANDRSVVFASLRPRPNLAAFTYPVTTPQWMTLGEFAPGASDHDYFVVSPIISQPLGDVALYSVGRGRTEREIEELSYRFGPRAPQGAISPDGFTAIIWSFSQNRFVFTRSDRRHSIRIGELASDRYGWPAWSPEGSRVAIASWQLDATEPALQIEIYSGEGTLERSLSVEAATASQSGDLGLRWIDETHLVVEISNGLAVHARFDGESWRTESQGNPLSNVSVIQDANTQPSLTLITQHQSQILLTPNEELLNGVQLARTVDVDWIERGEAVHGLLTLPSVTAGSPPPLVIQPYFYAPDRFLAGGFNRTTDAPQLLASRGFAVLTFDVTTLVDHSRGDGGVAPETARMARRINAAVASLAERQLIDPTRIALTGFSRSGMLAYYLATHPDVLDYTIRAFVISDAWSVSFSGFAETSVLMPLSGHEYPRQNGGHTFWEAKNEWLQWNPNFNVDRVNAPVLLSNHGGAGVGDHLWDNNSETERVGLFLSARRPVEYLFFPGAPHQLRQPRQRVAMQEAVVDWLSFWLLGLESADPRKAQQVERWRRLRSEWEIQQAWEAEGNARTSPPSQEFRALRRR